MSADSHERKSADDAFENIGENLDALIFHVVEKVESQGYQVDYCTLIYIANLYEAIVIREYNEYQFRIAVILDLINKTLSKSKK